MNDLERRLSELLKEISAQARSERDSRRETARRRVLGRHRRRWVRTAAAAGAVAAVVIAGVTVVTRTGDGDEKRPGIAADPAIETFIVGRHPYDIAVGADSVWVTDTNLGAVHRLEPETGDARALIPLGGRPEDLDLDGDYVWVSDPSSGTITLLSALTNDILGGPEALGPRHSTIEMAATAGRAWIAVNSRRLVILQASPEGPLVVPHEIALGDRLHDVAIGLASVWVLGDNGVHAIDPLALAPRSTFATAAGADSDLVVGAGALWVAHRGTSLLTKIGADTGEVLGSAAVPGRYLDMAVGEGVIWVLTTGLEGRATVTSIDVATVTAVGEPVELEGRPTQITTGGGDLWASDATSPRIAKVVSPED